MNGNEQTRDTDPNPPPTQLLWCTLILILQVTNLFWDTQSIHRFLSSKGQISGLFLIEMVS